VFSLGRLPWGRHGQGKRTFLGNIRLGIVILVYFGDDFGIFFGDYDGSTTGFDEFDLSALVSVRDDPQKTTFVSEFVGWVERHSTTLHQWSVPVLHTSVLRVELSAVVQLHQRKAARCGAGCSSSAEWFPMGWVKQW
jgi:hypothetical protein